MSNTDGTSATPTPDATSPQPGNTPPAFGSFINSVKMGATAIVATAATAAAVFAPHLNTMPDLDTINGCGINGRATNAMQTSLNPLKNRYNFPTAADIAPQASLETMLSSTQGQLDQSKAATIEGYITLVKTGGIESCNCGTTVPQFMDTHIYVNATPQFDEKHAVIVEVTPRLRQEMQGTADWSTPSLIQLLKPGTRARITGWLFYDAEHENASENIHPGAPHNWRGTCWEIHPVTDIEMEEAEQDAQSTSPGDSDSTAKQPSTQ
jgi:hypothetical protein